MTDFDGTIILVSHDRAFLDNIVSSVWVFEGNGRIEEYVGGYSDWHDHHREPAANPKNQSTSDADKKTTKVQPAKSIPAQKLAYKEQQELNELPGLIESLETEKQDLEQQMGQGDFYQQDEQVIKDSLQRLDELKAQLDNAYQRWEQLENRA